MHIYCRANILHKQNITYDQCMTKSRIFHFIRPPTLYSWSFFRQSLYLQHRDKNIRESNGRKPLCLRLLSDRRRGAELRKPVLFFSFVPNLLIYLTSPKSVYLGGVTNFTMRSRMYRPRTFVGGSYVPSLGRWYPWKIRPRTIHPLPPSFPTPVSKFYCVSPVDWRERGGGRSQIIRRRESLVLYNPLTALWKKPAIQSKLILFFLSCFLYPRLGI